MAWEPETLEAPSTNVQPITEVAPGFPIEFENPAHVELLWGGDRGHFPEALTPLAGDYARVVGSTLNGWQSDYDGFPQRWHTGVWHGCVYYAFEPNATPAEWADIHRRANDLWRNLADETEAMWRDDILPEVRSLYARMDAMDADGAAADVAEAWESAWLVAERAWKLHVMPAGGIQVLTELAETYKSSRPSGSRRWRPRRQRSQRRFGPDSVRWTTSGHHPTGSASRSPSRPFWGDMVISANRPTTWPFRRGPRRRSASSTS
jgi:hypothetical protein